MQNLTVPIELDYKKYYLQHRSYQKIGEIFKYATSFKNKDRDRREKIMRTKWYWSEVQKRRI